MWLFGIMPAADVEISKTYKDQYGMHITIEAGKTGWSVLWADGGTDYKQVEDTAENNFQKAIDLIKSHHFELAEIKPSFVGEY